MARIFHADLFGKRQDKYAFLSEASLADVEWAELSPTAPAYLFVPQEQEVREEYEQGWSVKDIFPVNGVGMTTARDGYVIDFEDEKVLARAEAFKNATGTDAEVCARLGIALKEGWNVTEARRSISSEFGLQQFLRPILYRPFDTRTIFYHDSLVWRTVRKVMQHMKGKQNLGLIVSRQVTAEFRHAFCTRLITNFNAIDTAGRFGSGCLFPLYLYPAAGSLEEQAEEGPRPNLSRTFVAALTERVGFEPTPEDIFAYAYGVFHAPTYRARYAEFLKRAFPRLPLPPDADAFRACAHVGAPLVALHLLEDPALDNHGIGYPVGGSHHVEKMRPDARYLPPPADGGKPGRVRLNDTEYFENVPPEAWNFRVGGYLPAQKWLDDRAGRNLTEDDITHYRRVIAALRETAALLPAADAAFAAIFPDSARTAVNTV